MNTNLRNFFNMCEWFNPKFGCRCERGHEATGYKCCNRKGDDCPDYQPTKYVRVREPAS